MPSVEGKWHKAKTLFFVAVLADVVVCISTE